MFHITLNYWGWKVKLSADRFSLLDQVRQLLPPGLPVAGPADSHFELHSSGLFLNGERVTLAESEGVLLEALEGSFQIEVASHAPEAVFVHAGVVGMGGQVLLLPGKSFAGKSTLVHALCKRGADYFSDEYAVINHQGRVQPYRRPITLRQSSSGRRRIPAEQFPLDPEAAPRSLGWAISCQYGVANSWSVQPVTCGQGVLTLLSNTVSARLSPQRDLVYLARAAESCQFFEGLRGEVDEAVEKILALAELR